MKHLYHACNGRINAMPIHRTTTRTRSTAARDAASCVAALFQNVAREVVEQRHDRPRKAFAAPG
jgi:hypothetical protein